ncbi:MAG: phosphoribosylformylglycinamidine synthase [Nitratiruptor sp.]|nr:phosphoribosylformylglycinamidine synthase [Nitratiruptor sp.]NPA84053.1 phosphoribosylformylglycinamidine synthase subunit PurS [Campylobacterota bacterium]
MRAVVNIHLKQGVLDPQGKAVHHALGSLGFHSPQEVRVGKQILLELREGLSHEEALEEVRQMCERLLANTVIEEYQIEILP